MSTRGFIGMHRNGETRLTYNHSDSYPSWLGEKTLNYIRRSNVEADAEKYFALPIVSEDIPPTPEQAEDLKARGYWKNVSDGSASTIAVGYPGVTVAANFSARARDWYSLLRDAQGDIEDQIEAGYLLTIGNNVLTEKDIFIEWGYVIDVDAKELVVYEGQSNGPAIVARFPFDQIKSEGFDIDQAVSTLEPNTDD